MSKLCIDLCSGLGGFSQAFVDAGWDVVRIDIERKFKPTIQADVMHLPLKSECQPEVLLTSPPCQGVSLASVYRHWKDRKPIDKVSRYAIKLAKRMKAEIKRLNPRFGELEQPYPSMAKHIYGKPDHRIRLSDFGAEWKKPTGLWELGRERVPFPMLTQTVAWRKTPRGTKNWGVQGWAKKPEERAKMPYGLGKAILEAVDSKQAGSESR